METFSALLAILRGIHRSPVNSLHTHKGQWRGALMLSLICAWINVWVNIWFESRISRLRDLTRSCGKTSVRLVNRATGIPWGIVSSTYNISILWHDDVIKWKHFPHYWPFMRGIHRSPVNSPHKGQWRGALMFSLICTRINGWVNNGEAGDLRRHRTHYDVIEMKNRNDKASLCLLRKFQLLEYTMSDFFLAES